MPPRQFTQSGHVPLGASCPAGVSQPLKTDMSIKQRTNTPALQELPCYSTSFQNKRAFWGSAGEDFQRAHLTCRRGLQSSSDRGSNVYSRTIVLTHPLGLPCLYFLVQLLMLVFPVSEFCRGQFRVNQEFVQRLELCVFCLGKEEKVSPLKNITVNHGPMRKG